jgi:hypothetical protein
MCDAGRKTAKPNERWLIEWLRAETGWALGRRHRIDLGPESLCELFYLIRDLEHEKPGAMPWRGEPSHRRVPPRTTRATPK